LNFHGAEQGRRMLYALHRARGEIDRPEHGRRQNLQHGLFKRGHGGEPQMLVGARGEIDTGLPDLVKGVCGCTDEAGQKLYSLKLAQIDIRKHALDRTAQRFRIDRLSEAASEAGSHLLNCDDMGAVALVARGVETELTRRQTAVHNIGMPLHAILSAKPIIGST
jgi:hypothetical protein